MKTVLISGATGFVGEALALRLAGSGHLVHALYRSEAKAEGLKHKNIKLFKADLTDPAAIDRAMKGCEQVYHLAAFASVWTPDPGKIYEQNVQGTVNMLESARKHGVKRVVHTSTAGVFSPSVTGSITEDTPIAKNHFIHYDRSKFLAEQKVQAFVKEGMNVVLVNPSRIYGPGKLGDSNGVTRLIIDYVAGKWHIIPGNGKSVGNYVYIDDVVEGHILAMEKGGAGEQYLLGGSNLSFNEFFAILKEETGCRFFLIRVPLFIGISIAAIMLLIAKLTGRMPLITPGLLKRYSHHWGVSHEKAGSELGYDPVDFRVGLKKTLAWWQTVNAGNGQ